MQDDAPTANTETGDGGSGAPPNPLPPPSPVLTQRSTLNLQPPPAIPDHEMLRCVGRGAYGEVWLARHARLGTLRAVKIIRRDQFDHDRPFQREFDGIRRYEPISRGHPNLVAILHVGGSDECFFYVMELADNGDGESEPVGKWESEKTAISARTELPPAHFPTFSLANYSPHTLRSEMKHHGPLPIDRCLEIGRALAGALAHLHARGLVHRDVKPSNVIFVGGVAKLADIGLVAAVSDSRSYVGTEGYIPPEGPGAPSADCYALGKLLYELSTGHDRTAWPEPPADLPARPDRERLLELNAILHKACAPQPSERYRDADAMLADLEQLVRGKSVRSLHRVERHWQSVRRGALWLLVGTGALALLLLAARLGQPPANVESGKRSTNSAANDLYDIGRSHYLKNTEDAIRKAAEKYQAAVEADPNFALAWAALAAAWCWGGFDTNLNFPNLSRARESAERALAMDDALGEAHLTLALHAYIREWDWPKAEAEYQKAIRCDPSNPQSHEWYGLFLRSVGRTQHALREFKLAVNLNPHSVTANRFLVNGLVAARQFREAISKARKVAELGDSVDIAPDALLWCGEIEESIRLNEQGAVARGRPADMARSEVNELRDALREGTAAFWNKRLEIMQRHGGNIVVLAGASAAAGRVEESLDLLDQAYQSHNDWLIWDLAAHPQWDNLRGQPRFQELLRKLRLEPVAGLP